MYLRRSASALRRPHGTDVARRGSPAVVFKRSVSPGFAGIDNDLFYEPNTSMLFADAKQAAADIAAEIQNL